MTTAPPKATKTAGRRLWKSIMDDYDLSGAELEILRQAVRVADVLDDLAAIVAAEGVIENGTGRAHPAVVEQRQESIALARLLASLRLPDSAESARTQHRGPRGVYELRGASCKDFFAPDHALGQIFSRPV
jgi:hypothetical protein